MQPSCSLDPEDQGHLWGEIPPWCLGDSEGEARSSPGGGLRKGKRGSGPKGGRARGRGRTTSCFHGTPAAAALREAAARWLWGRGRGSRGEPAGSGLGASEEELPFLRSSPSCGACARPSAGMGSGGKSPGPGRGRSGKEWKANRWATSPGACFSAPTPTVSAGANHPGKSGGQVSPPQA